MLRDHLIFGYREGKIAQFRRYSCREVGLNERGRHLGGVILMEII